MTAAAVWADAAFEARTAGCDEPYGSGNDASVAVLGSDAMDGSGIEVGAGDVGLVEFTRVAYAISVPRAGPARLEPWIPCSARDEVVSG